jgi:peptidoglycan/LPS O-acetylase OafA/YrhL
MVPCDLCMDPERTTCEMPAAVPAVAALPSSSRRIPELDGLRGFAILQVVLFHYFSLSNFGARGGALGYCVKIFGLGWTGVDLFFVLSGFLIGGILLESRESPGFFQTFYLRRVHRILPVYFLWILLYVVILSLPAHWFPAALAVGDSSLSVVPRYLLFVQNLFFRQQHFQLLWFGATWSLAVEEQFYVVAPFLIWFMSARALKWTIASTIILVPMVRSVVFLSADPGWHYIAAQEMPFRADELAVGIGCAMLWREVRIQRFLAEHKRLLYRGLFALSCGVLGAAWWLLHPTSIVTVAAGYSLLALFYATLMLVVLTDTSGRLARLARLNALRELGTISYCVYVIHVAVNGLCHAFLLGGEPRVYDWPGLAVTLLAFLVTVGLAQLSWKYYERPLVRRGHGYSYGSRPEPSADFGGESGLPAGAVLASPAKGAPSAARHGQQQTGSP